MHYFHVVFTLPAELRAVAKRHRDGVLHGVPLSTTSATSGPMTSALASGVGGLTVSSEEHPTAIAAEMVI